jgi:diaminopimelate decarboxylase
MDMETEIMRVKSPNETPTKKTLVVIKSSIYGGLIDEVLYNKRFEMFFEDKNGNQTPIIRDKNATNNLIQFYICGGSPDSGDRFGFGYVDDDKYLKSGTKIIIKDVGTYCLEFIMPLGNLSQIKYKFIK